VVHDDIYFFSYGTNSSASGGMYMLDLKSSGFGLVRLDYFANAMFSDPLTDKLYLAQTDVATSSETVLFLFHMTETATAEGVNEFGGAQIVDQTGAAWTTETEDWDLSFSNPYPMFGSRCLTATDGTNTAINRQGSNLNVPRPDNDAFAIDAWLYLSEANAYCTVWVNFNIRLGTQAGTYVASASDGTGMTAPVDLDGGPVLLDEWVHLRANYDGTTFRLFVNGNMEASGAIDLSPVASLGGGANIDIETGGGTINAALDEVYAVVGTALSTTNFTPPVARWPNP
jgi:hypothetical protein